MYRVFEAGRAPYMREKGGITEKMTKYIDGIYSMLEEMESCLEEMEGGFGERDEYEGERMGYRMGDGRMGDGIAFTRFHADCIAKGMPIMWEEML